METDLMRHEISDKFQVKLMFIILCFRLMYLNHIFGFLVSNFKSSSSNIPNNLTHSPAFKVHSSECFPRQQLRWSIYTNL